jgi:hypothetical protein
MIACIIVIVLLTGLCTYLGYRVWFLAGALGDVQEQDTDMVEYIDGLEATNLYMYDKIMQTYAKMQEIDTKGAFEAEDEVGTTFQLLKEVIETLKDEFINDTQTEK